MDKRVEVTKERHGSDFYKRAGAIGGRSKSRGYFGWLKDNDPEKFADLHQRAVRKAAEKNRKKPKQI